ncbi:hypothetical protein H5410_036509 [Solanum commersonii]|uniref:Uncharacterized protein n=1 Tax=Solanum commersonii TaxID=4109 RepID=A0A9J5Y511_SOLCO|nr:hypothetical protein H5410_036509 [Solanum commersonii]
MYLKARVGKAASASKESTSTSGDVSTRASLILSDSSFMYSASMHRMSMEDVGVTSISLFSFNRFLAMIDLRQATFGWRRMGLFCDGMIELLINPN